MTLNIEILVKRHEAEYDAMLNACPHALVYYTSGYRRFLSEVLAPAECAYIGAFEAGQLVAAMPAFVKQSPKLGAVINSLPFYGSHGGVLLSRHAQAPDRVRVELLGAFHSLALTRKATATTVVANLHDPESAPRKTETGTNLKDYRIGQLTPLPETPMSDEALSEVLMRLYHVKTRNCVRKAQKSKIEVTHDDSTLTLDYLARQHQANIDALGGAAKPFAVFAAIRNAFGYDRDYRVYMARKDGKAIAALLVFFHPGAAEYYIPASDPDYRVYQPMSLLIFEAMKEACRRRCRYWNWGGTWKTQDGVYHFKKRWGTIDFPYTYHIGVYDASILHTPKEQLLAEYPYFYTVPFSELRS